MAISHFGYVIKDVASLTPEDLQIGPHLPVDFSPGDSVSFPDESNELLEVPGPVDNMLGSNLSVIIDVRFALGAVEHLPLAHSEQFVAEGALVEVVALLLQQKFQFFHEQTRHQLVFTLLQDVQTVKGHFSGHLSDDLGVDAAHIDLHFGDFFDVLDEEVQALLHESIDLQEVSGDQDGHSVLNVKLWSVVLLDGRLFVVAIGFTFLNCQLPPAAATDAVQDLVTLLLLLELLHGEDVVEQPLENDCVAVDRNVDLILV